MDGTRDVDFHYYVHHRGGVVCQKEVEALGQELPVVDVALACSVEESLYPDDMLRGRAHVQVKAAHRRSAAAIPTARRAGPPHPLRGLRTPVSVCPPVA